MRIWPLPCAKDSTLRTADLGTASETLDEIDRKVSRESTIELTSKFQQDLLGILAGRRPITVMERLDLEQPRHGRDPNADRGVSLI